MARFHAILMIHIVLVTICHCSLFNRTLPSNFTTPFPLKNNCTESTMVTFNRLLTTIEIIKSPKIHQNTTDRPIDPFCIVPDAKFNNTFMPDFYCPTMEPRLYCNKTEELLYLHDFYHSLGGDHWKHNRHWLDPNIDYCKWYGIYCCNTSYPLYQTCINIINLSDNNLTGTLPSTWINSSVLTIFVAKHNHLSGTIPEYHERLPNLSVFAINIPLSFADHTITGSIPSWPSAGCLTWFDVHGQMGLRYDKIIHSLIPRS